MRRVGTMACLASLGGARCRGSKPVKFMKPAGIKFRLWSQRVRCREELLIPRHEILPAAHASMLRNGLNGRRPEMMCMSLFQDRA